MRLGYPSSFLKLLLIGFALALLPLLFAFANAALYLDRLANQSQETVYQAVEATRTSRLLTEQLTLMERSVRQHLVLGDDTLLEHYVAAHQHFEQAARTLSRLPLDHAQRDQLEAVNAKEHKLYVSITEKPIQANEAKHIVGEFVELSSMAQTILDANSRLIDRETAVLAETAGRAQHMLLWQTLTLIPVALLVAAAITFLLAQPIRRMDSAIHQLGRGEYEEIIAIDGPGDLRTLGERLDWLRSQLQDLEEQKKRFLRHVSHELKTPLTAIREGSELLAEEVGGALSPQQKEITHILRENSLRLQKMIENLLNYTSVQFQQPELNLSEFPCKSVVEQVLANHALTLGSKEIKTLPTLADIRMLGDKEKLLSIVDNLISNAIKFTPRNGTIGIRVSKTGESVVLDVSDTGPGIAPADRPHLFEPFYQGSGVHDGRISGSGLGLSIVKEYVEAHGGSISLEHSDQGARFRVILPILAKVSHA